MVCRLASNGCSTTLLAATLSIVCLAANAQTSNAPVASESTPQFESSPVQLGDSLMVHKSYQAAIAAYKKAPQTTAEIWNKMGVANQLMLNTEEAMRCYKMALKLEPKSAIVINNLGSIYLAQKQYSQAERAYRKAIKLDPHSALFHKNLGTALLAERKYNKGWEAYQQALAIDPTIFTHSTSVRVENPASVQDLGAMNYYMARSCMKAGMNDRAIYYLRRAVNEGFISPRKIATDAEFAALWDLPAFQELMEAQQQNPSPVGRPAADTPRAR